MLTRFRILRFVVRTRNLMRTAVGVIGHARQRRATRSLLQFDERLLRDIGLTRNDVVDCLSSPWHDPVEFLDARRAEKRRFRPRRPAAQLQDRQAA